MIKSSVCAIIALTFIGCISRFDLIKEPSDCVNEIPREVEAHFKNYQKTKPRWFTLEDARQWGSITNGTHEDLYMIREGVIASKKHGWRCNVKFRPVIMFENNNYFVVSVGYKADYFHPIGNWWLIIRKNDGKILRSYDTPMLNGCMEYNGILYVQTIDNGPEDPSEILCMKLEE